MKNSLHIAISTGQNIANIIPMLALGNPGDYARFISSDTAENQGWTGRAEKVLKKYRFKIVPGIRVDDNEQLALLSISRFLKESLQGIEKKWEQIFVHLTGGQKITAIAVFEAVRDKNVTFVYMDNQPVQMVLISSASKEQKFVPIPATVELDDLLAIYGSRRSEACKGDRPIQLNKPENIVLAKDRELVTALFTSYNIPDIPENDFFRKMELHVRNLYPQIREKSLGLLSDIDYIYSPFHKYIKNLKNTVQQSEKDKINNYLSQQIDRALKTVKNILLDSGGRSYEIPLTRKQKSALIENQFLDADRLGYPVFRKHLKKRIGFFFEDQVIQRLKLFFEHYPEYKKIVSEIWSGLKIEARDNPGKITGEYDAFIVLRNGISISLECKTFFFDEKDLFARIARLTRRTSLLSRQWVVIPFFTEPDLFTGHMLQNYLNLKRLGISIIPFGRMGQPETFYDDKNETELYIPSFEDALKQNLQRYKG